LISSWTIFLYVNSFQPAFWAGIGAVAGVYLFYRGFKLLQRKRLILNTPASKIRSASMGLVEVNGLAAGPYTMVAPITGVPCYYFRTIAWQWKQAGKNKSWVKVADESMHLPFFLDDNTGRVLVDPQGAEMDIHRDFQDEFSTSLFSSNLQVPQNVASFLARHAVAADKKLKVEEYCIKPKNALFIVGTLAQNPGLNVAATPVRTLTVEPPSSSFSLPLGNLGLGSALFSTGATMSWSTITGEPCAQEVTLAGKNKETKPVDTTQQEKITAALLKAGVTSPAAWAAAGIRTSVTVTTSGPDPAMSNGAAEQFDLHPPVVIMKGSHNPAFFISWRSQRAVVGSLSWKSTLMIWGGPALTLFCVYLVAAQFGWL
jgi:hypothetical protein